MNPREKKIWLAAALVAALTFSIYLFSVNNEFVNWDDYDYVKQNTEIRVMNKAFVLWAFTSFKNGNWNPLTWVSYAVDYQIWGLDVRGYHLHNNLLHACCTFLVILFVYRIGCKMRDQGSLPSRMNSSRDLGVASPEVMLPVFTGLLFGLHPLRVESVAWISERKDVLCGVFYLLSLITYYSRHPAGVVLSRSYLLSLLFFFCAVMAKPMAVTLPLVILLLDVILFRTSLGRSWPARLPFFILSVLVGIITMQAQSSEGALWQNRYFTLSERIVNTINGFRFYVFKTLYPSPLYPIYPMTEQTTGLNGYFLVSCITLLAITLLCLAAWKQGHRAPMAAWACYATMLLPVSGLVAFGEQAVADRYSYLPGVALTFLVAFVCANMIVQNSKIICNLPVITGGAFVLLSFFAVVLSSMTIRQITIWKDTRSLWQHMIAGAPESTPTPYVGMGLWFLDKGLYPEAYQYCNHGLSLGKGQIKGPECRAEALLGLGRHQEAAREYTRVLMNRPQNVTALRNRGTAYLRMQQYTLAEADYKSALAIRAKEPVIMYNLACLYALQNRTGEACTWLIRAVQNGFDDKDAMGKDRDLESVRRASCYGTAVTMMSAGSR